MELFGDRELNNNAKQLAQAVFQEAVSMIECPDEQPPLSPRKRHQLSKSTRGNAVLIPIFKSQLYSLSVSQQILTFWYYRHLPRFFSPAFHNLDFSKYAHHVITRRLTGRRELLWSIFVKSHLGIYFHYGSLG